MGVQSCCVCVAAFGCVNNVFSLYGVFGFCLVLGLLLGRVLWLV